MISSEITRKFSGEEHVIARYEASESGMLTRVEVFVLDLDEFVDVDIRRFQYHGSKLLILIQKDLRERVSRMSHWEPDGLELYKREMEEGA